MKPQSVVDFPKEQDEIGPEMCGADILVKALEREGVEVIFAYPGGASMEMHQSLNRSKKDPYGASTLRTRRWIHGSWLCSSHRQG